MEKLTINELSELKQTCKAASARIQRQFGRLLDDSSHLANSRRVILTYQLLSWSVAMGNVLQAIEDFKSNCTHKRNYTTSHLEGEVVSYQCNDCGYARRKI